MSEDTKKIGFDIPLSMAETFDDMIPWGQKNKVVLIVLSLLEEELRDRGHQVITDLIDGNMELKASSGSNRAAQNLSGPGDSHV